MNQDNFSSLDLYYYNINKLVNLYKENNELVAEIITSNIFTRENHVFTQDYLKNVIDQIMSLNRNISDNIIRIINNSQNSQTRSSNRNLNSNTNRLRYRDNRITINGLPYIIDSIERYPLYSPISQRQNNLRDFFEPVEVYPTQEQIENATRIVRYSDILRPLNSSCPISLERFNDSDYVSVIRHCSHIFNTNELNNWFRTNCKCPVCRYDIRNYNPSDHIDGILNIDSSNNTTSEIDENNNTTQSNETTQNNNNSNDTSERNNNNNSNNRINNNRLVQQILNTIDGINLSIPDNSNENTIEHLFYTLIDSSGNNLLNTRNNSQSQNTLNTINQLWNIYRNI